MKLKKIPEAEDFPELKLEFQLSKAYSKCWGLAANYQFLLSQILDSLKKDELPMLKNFYIKHIEKAIYEPEK